MPDIVCLSESWLNNRSPNCFSIDGYDFIVRNRRKDIRGGGVAIYVKDITRLRSSLLE